MLSWRILISSLLVPGFVALFVLDHRSGDSAYFLLGLCLLLAGRGSYELAELLRQRGFNPNGLLAAGCSICVACSGWASTVFGVSVGTSLDRLGPLAVAYSLSVLVLFLSGAVRYRKPGHCMENLGAELLIVSYVGVLLGVTAQLRWVAGAQAGYLALGSLVIAAKCGDIGAYTLGRLFGRRKMVPLLSPGKTWMGAVGALLGSGLGALLWLQMATPRFDSTWEPCGWFWAMLYGMIVGVAGLIGDLCESLVKRDVGCKDSAALFPGFGGLLDLLDSILYAGPVAYLLWQVLPLLRIA